MAYVDTLGHPTVGIGYNLDRPTAREDITRMALNYDAVRAGKVPLAIGQVEFLFSRDFEAAMSDARTIVGIDCWCSLPEDCKIALTDMSFNLGFSKLRKFKKLIAAIVAGDFRSAAAEALNSEWSKQVGARATHNAQLFLGCTHG